DIDGDGKTDLLLSKSRDGFIYESPSANQLPVNLIWTDTGNGNFWSSRIADTDGDGNKEILGLGRSGLRIIEASGDNSYAQTANLNYFGIDSTPNSQNVMVEDFDADGKNDIAFINLYYETRSSALPKTGVSVYETNGNNSYTRIFKDSIDRVIKGDNIVSGDFNGDGKKDFALGVVSKDGDLIQYYSLYVYTSTMDNNYSILDVQDIYNYKSYAETSTKAADIDNDGIDEILVNTGTLFYIFKFDNALGRFKPVFFMKDINTVNQIVYDFDANGIKEIGLNTVNDTLLFFEKNAALTGPLTPLGFKGYSLDSNIIKLTFENVAGAEYYKIYRSDTTENFIFLDSTTTNEYLDNGVINRKNYYYKISAVDIQNPVRESELSLTLMVYSHSRSKIVSVVYEQNGFLSVIFSERVSTVIPNLSSFFINNNIGNPKNIAVKNNFEYFLTFEKPLPDGSYTISARELADIYGSPADTSVFSFNVVNDTDSGKFYIAKLELSGDHRLKVEFNLEADSLSVKNVNNYNFEPFDIRVKSVEIDNSNRKAVYLNLEKTAAIGATGKNYLLKAFNIYSSGGLKIVDGAGSSFGLIFNKETLDEMYVYPNPYSISSGQDYITLANITRDALIDIFDLTGKFLINIKETNGNGGVEWDLKDRDGNKISTGIYLYRASGKNSSGQDVKEKIGKFAVVK
ncbi:MAG: FG-GAP-like repeat-containing protein, partial [Bacteroidota bacterium]|nr:FG-GAP-like repeat-containing protein [Bacteroidota bacterium]